MHFEFHFVKNQKWRFKNCEEIGLWTWLKVNYLVKTMIGGSLQTLQMNNIGWNFKPRVKAICEDEHLPILESLH